MIVPPSYIIWSAGRPLSSNFSTDVKTTSISALLRRAFER